MKPSIKKSTEKQLKGFSLTELLVTVAIIGTMSAVIIPGQIRNLCRAESNEAVAMIGSIQAIIAAYIDETGVFPSSWNDLSSISTIMTNSGSASGDLTSAITLPSELYELTINGPENSIYNITANRLDGCPNRDINACINASNGASEIISEDGEEAQRVVNCT